MTLSLINTTQRERLTPFNINQREILVEYPAGNTLGARAFTRSNYFCLLDMATGRYYFYFVDYIDVIQNVAQNGALSAYPSAVCYRVGITLDYWQTYYFAMQTKYTSSVQAPNYVAPHSVSIDTATEVVIPPYDFANIERTNMDSIINAIWANKSKHFRPLRVPKVYTYGAQNRRYRIISDSYSMSFGIVAKISISATEAAARTGGTFWIFIDNNFKTWNFSNKWNGNALGWLNTILTSTGKLQEAYNDTTVGLSFAVNSNYKLLEAYFVPYDIAQQILPLTEIKQRATLYLQPTNYAANAFLIRSYFLPPFNLAMSMLASGGTSTAKTNTPRAAVTYAALKSYLNAVLPNVTNIPHEQLLPYLTVGTDRNKIAVTPTIPHTAQAWDNADYCTPSAAFADTDILFWLEMRQSPYAMQIILSNGVEEVDVAPQFRLPLREVVDSEEVERQKQSYELGNISKGIGLLSSGIGLAGSVATGNVVGAVMSTAQIASQGVSLFNSVANAPDFSKQMRENVSNNTSDFSAFIAGIFIYIPSDFTGDDSAIAPTYMEEYTEIGVEIGATFRASDAPTLSNAPTKQKTGFIQMGCVLLGIQQEAGEILEKRFREGVTFWYE